MQIDMHFYAVYALARAAGLDVQTAQTIAQASQFVDDAVEDEHALIANTSAIVPTMTSHRPLDYRNSQPGEQWKVWIPFHFLPGSDPKAATFVERMVTLADSRPARQMLSDSLDEKNRPYWPHLIGIVSHVYADTFSHFGFVGYASQWNQVLEQNIQITNLRKRSAIFKYIMGKLEEFKTRLISPIAEIIPVGHGAVATLPDRPYLQWRFRYQTHSGKPSYVNRSNPDDYLQACRKLHKYFHDFGKKSSRQSTLRPNKRWNAIEGAVKSLLKTAAPVDERIYTWKKALAGGVFCKPAEEDKTIKYDESKWIPHNLRHERRPGQDYAAADTCCYIRAAWRHRNYVLHELLPDCGLVTC